MEDNQNIQKNETLENTNTISIEEKIINQMTNKVSYATKTPHIKGNLIKNHYWKDNLFTFCSNNLDIHKAMELLSFRNEKGVMDLIMNIISENLISDSFFYLPQLIILLSSKAKSKSIETFLLDRCINQMKFSLFINWIVNACTEDNKLQNIKNKKYEKLVNRIEMTLVNGKRSTMSNHSQYKMKIGKSQAEIILFSLKKEIRLDYYNEVTSFYSNLKTLCQDLKQFPKEPPKGCEHSSRNYQMRRKVKVMSWEIHELYKKVSPKAEMHLDIIDLFRGIILPFNDCDKVDDGYNNLIVRMLPEHSMCFSTKARVPVKIVVECVRAIECENWDAKFNFELDKQQEEELSKFAKEDPEDLIFETDKKRGKTVSTSSTVDDFLTPQAEKNAEEIKKILNDVKYANEHPEFEQQKLNEIRSTITEHSKRTETKEWLSDHNPIKDNPFGEKWDDIIAKIKANSPYAKFETYSVQAFIAKADDDLRQEVMTMQLIKVFDKIFEKANLKLKLRPYEILVTSSSSGLIEFLPDTISIDGLKKKLLGTRYSTLSSFFENFFSGREEDAKKNFAESLAAYSLVSYLINIKDRHNGNILLDRNGNIIHIDFGFILGISPGNNMNFENAPFKLTNEYVDILGGEESPLFGYYTTLMIQGLEECRKHYSVFETIIYAMANGTNTIMPCFKGRSLPDVMKGFKERFHFGENSFTVVKELVRISKGNWRTAQYDMFQKLTNGILP